MRNTFLFNNGWHFTKENIDPAAQSEPAGKAVVLPHTWNAQDGQDGGNDYHRGKCWYSKQFARPALGEGEEAWLEFGGVNMVAEVWLNGTRLCRHAGGYSTFRAKLTPALQGDNLLLVSADNSRSREVYPQKADFTFYGGIYRDLKLITVPNAHFALDNFGAPGIQVTPKLENVNAENSENASAAITLEAFTENAPNGTPILFTIGAQEDGPKVGPNPQTAQASVLNGRAAVTIALQNPHLWNGVDDPFLYTATAELAAGTPGADKVEVRFGCRTFSVDANKGFFLNGRSYPLCGAARHQDREGAGYALTPEMHREDMELLKEMGANTVRLAHYQHDQYFYDLCDEAGMVVWAEIPYISEHMPEANANSESQMTELVLQNYNHASIVCWGLSNEITAACDITDDLMENHRRLNDLCHKLDVTRLTTMAHVFMLPIEHELVMLPDIRSYNLYFGWYLGEPQDNDKWFDAFHEKYPDAVIGLSEYGADANPQYQTANPERSDYSETYQALYHEHMLKMWSQRPYIWAMHVWNMFDFAADGRDEGGKHGINQKGLVTFDRKFKKDAYYIYKAYMAKEPFVHLCGSRYVDRPEDITEVKVYSNQPSVTLFVDGREFSTQQGDKVFVFEVPINAKHTVEAKSGGCTSVMVINKVAQANPDYAQPLAGVINWFDREEMEFKEGFYSIKDTTGDIKKSPAGAALLAAMMEKLMEKRGDVAKGVRIPAAMQEMMDRHPLQNTLKQAGDVMTPEAIVELNKALNQIPKTN